MSTSSEQRPGAAGAIRRDPVLRWLLALGLACAAWYLAPLGGPGARLALFWPVQVVFDAIFAVLAARMARRPELPASARRFWSCIPVAAGCFATADTIQGVETFRNPVAGMIQGDAVPLAFIALGSLVCLAAMVLHPTLTRGRERLRFVLDAATVVAATAVFVWYLSPSVDLRRGSAALLLALASAGSSIAGSFGLVKLILGRNMPFTPVAGWLTAVAGGLIGLSTGLTPALMEVARPEQVMLARLLPCLLLAAVPRINEVYLRADPEVMHRRPARPFSLLPYIGVAAVFGLLVVALAGGRLNGRVWGVVAGVALVTGVVVVRQLVAFADNARLLGAVDRSMRALAEQEERFRALVQHSSDVILIADPDHVVTYASPAVERALGAPPEAVTGRRMEDLVAADGRDELGAALAGLLARPGATTTLRLRVPHAGGGVRWLSAVATNLLHVAGIRGVVYNAHDVTEVVALEERLRHEATHDPLTGLPNRALFAQRIAAAGGTASVLIIDLDGFKAVNDTYGHHAGDALLRAVADRLRGCVGPADTVTRMGGDEFAVLLPGTSLADAEALVVCLHEALAEPVPVDAVRLPIRASIGVAFGAVSRADDLLREADAAMYAAKHGRDRQAAGR